MTLFDYKVVPPTNLIEASTSPRSDDINSVYIRIEAKAKGPIAANDLQEIRIMVADTSALGGGETADTAILKGALTRTPGTISPVAGSFEKWAFNDPEDNVFIARPTVMTGNLAEDDETTFEFLLYDVEVVDQVGETSITITEVPAVGDPEPYDDAAGDLKIRKIAPGLRIDYFRAITPVVDISDSDVTLAWATTAATGIELYGPEGVPDGRIDLNDDTTVRPQPNADGQTDDSFMDATIKLTPAPVTTSTYTLVATNNDIGAVATQQVTITVSDQSQTDRLIVGDNATRPENVGGIAADTITVTTGAGSVEAKTVTADTVKTDSLQSKDSGRLAVTANSLKLMTNKVTITETGNEVEGYFVPAGGIIMWSGAVADIPDGWTLCNGKNNDGTKNINIPDLSGKFIVGVHPTNQKFLTGGDGGSETQELTTSNLPEHSHQGEVVVSGAHKHKNGNEFSVVTNVLTGATHLHQHLLLDNDPPPVPNSPVSVSLPFTAGESHDAEAFDILPPYYTLAFIIRLPVPALQ